MSRWRGLWRWATLALLVAAVVPLAMQGFAAAPKFPALSGRVVDDARILSPDTRGRLAQLLEAFERDTKRQVVVATIADLQGNAIGDYGYQLGRFWGIGEKGKNSGALLIVAPKDRQVRIEVGYGLEGELTDAIARQIIEQEILPHFRTGNFDAGTIAGTLGMLRALGWQGAGPAPQRASLVQQSARFLPLAMFFMPLVVYIIFVLVILRVYRGKWYHVGIYRSGGPFGTDGVGGHGSSGGGGSFGGGGGSFGGGGASGQW